MGRVSKRKAAERKAAVNDDGMIYRAGVYARLSSGQDAGKNESIDSQIEIAKKFAEEFNRKENKKIINIVEYYIDLGKTGSHFEREGFIRLLQDIRYGKINCVIVKDLSRFGRNYLETGNYIENIFPFLGVRFIAVSDDFDTGKTENQDSYMASEIKNLINDMYAKDFSKKAKIHLKQRREEGSYVGGPPPYGYITVENDKKRILLPDKNTAPVVRFIYEQFIKSESYTAVACELNNRRINPPALYRKTGQVYWGMETGEYKCWDKNAVKRILNSETYTGSLVQGKTCITSRNEKNRIHKPEKDWVVINDSHEALIEKELYQQAHELQKKICRRADLHKHPSKDCPIGENCFGGVLYCGLCGRKMIRSSCVRQCVNGKKIRYDRYFCPKGRKKWSIGYHEPVHITKKELVYILLLLMHIEYDASLKDERYYIEYGKSRASEALKKTETELRAIDKDISHLYEKEECIYIDYHMGNIIRSEYEALKMQQKCRLSDLEKRQEREKSKRNKLNGLSEEYIMYIKDLLKFDNEKYITKAFIETFISKIYIYPEKRIEIIFAFAAQ
ncbi:MAG: recombinase family protein [Coprococcus sp.]